MKVLVAPLDWGLGHATRCVPVIEEFLRQGAEVDLAVVKSNAALLRELFPNLRQHLAPSYGIVYPKHGFNMGLWLLKNSGHLNAVMKFELHYAEEMVSRFHFDVLFSDNRFAFHSRHAYSIYMTHQRRIAFPKSIENFEGVSILWHNSFIKRFDELWIPDVEEMPGYAGTLSHVNTNPVPVRYVGPLSRFGSMTLGPADAFKEKKYKIVAIVSGVEPARSQFENQLREELKKVPGNHLVILGKPGHSIKRWKEGSIEFCNHLPTADFADAVRNAEWTVSRGGYTTVMDMAVLGARCIVVPTPGQYEQITLARNLASTNQVALIPSSKFSAAEVKKAMNRDVSLQAISDYSVLQDAVSSIMRKV